MLVRVRERENESVKSIVMSSTCNNFIPKKQPSISLLVLLVRGVGYIFEPTLFL